jgi:transcriptional regulator with XRE-family HTH domain
MTRTKSEPTSRIASLRRAKRKTQAQLAAEIGYSLSHYAMVEREPRLITECMLKRLAAVLGVVRPEELLP